MKEKKRKSDNWRKTLLSPGASIKEAIESLSQSSMQIILVVSNDNLLIGTVTDGDIRRGMLKDIQLTDKISSIMNLDPLISSPEMSGSFILKLMQSNSFSAIPIVDEFKHIKGLHLLNEIIGPQIRPNQMIIMAGGKGTRLLPKTENCPKPLLPLNGKPMLEHILIKAKEQGFRNFILSINYLGEMIEDYFSDGSKWGLSIEYIREKSPLGTAGSLSVLKRKLKYPVIVTNADVISDIGYGKLLDYHTEHQNSIATMSVRLHKFQHPFGVVNTDGVNIVGFEEKPVINLNIIAGVYVLEPETFNFLEDEEYCDMPSLFIRLKENNMSTIVYPIHETWHDIGRIEEYTNANESKE